MLLDLVAAVQKSFRIASKITKRAGWQWQRTRMTQPDRAARLWCENATALTGRQWAYLKFAKPTTKACNRRCSPT